MWCEHISACKIVPSSCDEARNLAFNGVPPRIPFHDFQLWQWDEDGDGGQERGPWEGMGCPNSGLLSHTPPPPHPRQSRPVSPPAFTANNLVLPGFLQLLSPSNLFSTNLSKTQTWSRHPTQKNPVIAPVASKVKCQIPLEGLTKALGISPHPSLSPSPPPG